MTPVFLVVGDTARNPARSGIQTVVRSLAAAFGSIGAGVRLILWNNRLGTMRPLAPELSVGPGAEGLRDAPGRWPRALWSQPLAWPWWLLAGGRGKFVPLHRHPLYRRAPAETWVVMPELMYKERAAQLVDYVHRRGWRLAVILYDTIPVDHPSYVPSTLPAQHAGYLRGFSRADLVLPISETSAEGWRKFLAAENLPGPPVHVCKLACDLAGVPRVRTPPVRPPGPESHPIRLLCVSTLEPRKNHHALLAAYELAATARPDLRLELDLVGAAYVGSHDIEEAVTAASRRLPGLRWHGQVEYEHLQELYAACDFSVYPSVVEGFGLPVIESLWFGRPCVCANFGVMSENAADGGCLTVNVHDPQALADAILQLAADPGLRGELTEQATTRPLKTWNEYAQEVLACLASH